MPPTFFAETINTILLLQAALQPSVGFGLLNYRWAFSAGRFYGVLLPVARPTPNLEENQWFRAFQLSPQGAASLWNEGGTMAERILPKSDDFHANFWVLLHAVKLLHGTDGFISPPKEGVLRIFSPEKSDGFGRVWTRELGYQRPARYLQTTKAAINTIVNIYHVYILKSWDHFSTKFPSLSKHFFHLCVRSCISVAHNFA